MPYLVWWWYLYPYVYLDVYLDTATFSGVDALSCPALRSAALLLLLLLLLLPPDAVADRHPRARCSSFCLCI
jgi:hypothetical protein